jgi:translation elongation factor EF-4
MPFRVSHVSSGFVAVTACSGSDFNNVRYVIVGMKSSAEARVGDTVCVVSIVIIPVAHSL